MRKPQLALMPALVLASGLSATAAEPTMTDAERQAFRAEVHDYLLSNPEVLMEMIALLDAKEKANAGKNDAELIQSNAAALFDDGYSYVAGNPQGRFTIVEFLDYQCGYCRKAQPALSELLSEDGDIRLIIKDFPILGPGSDLSARAAVATMIAEGPEAYGRLHDTLMAFREPIAEDNLDRALRKADLDPAKIRAAMADPEVDRRIAQNHALGQTLSISGTPTFVFQDQMVRGYVDLASMKKLVDDGRSVN